jgi:hypothetical protein
MVVVLYSFTSFQPLLGQVTTDPSLPFDEGKVVHLPAMTAYLGDLPHFISLVPADQGTFGGLSVPLVGWTDPLGQDGSGFHSGTPGIFFENIPYPLASNSLNLLPVSGSAQMLNFPARGWLGRQASYGAINLTAPDTTERIKSDTNIWGGTGPIGGAEEAFRSNWLGGDIHYRHGNPAFLGQTDSYHLISRENWLTTSDFNAGSGFLGMNGPNNSNWYSAYLDFDLSSPNFQTLQLKPYFQTAQNGSQSVQEAGGFLNYLFNLAGLAQSHIGLGFSSDSGTTVGNNGFLQSTNLVDVLGDLTMDGAFRWDFSSLSNTAFSTVLGLQWKMDELALLGDYDKAVSPLTGQDIQQVDFGFKFQSNDTWVSTLKYINEQIGANVYHGGDLRLQLDRFDGFGLVRSFQLDGEERILADGFGTLRYDTGLTCRLRLTSQDEEWVRGRCFSGEPLFLEGGAAYSFGKELKIYGSVENLTAIPLALPDPDSPTGLVASFGVQYSAN